MEVLLLTFLLLYYEFLGIHVHKDYSSSRVRIMEKDSENIKSVQAIINKRETDLNFAKHGYEKKSGPIIKEEKQNINWGGIS